MPDLYETLGVAPDASPDEIKRAHREAVKVTHPDAGGDPGAFHRVQLAYGVLSDQRRRAKYDQTGVEEEADPADLVYRQAMTIVAAKMAAIIGMPQTDPRRFDLVAGVRELIAADRKTVQDQISGIKAMQERLRQFSRRLKRKKSAEGPDRVTPMLESQIANGDMQLAELDSQLQQLAAANDLVAEYVYKTDAEQPMMHPLGSGTGGGWQTTW